MARSSIFPTHFLPTHFHRRDRIPDEPSILSAMADATPAAISLPMPASLIPTGLDPQTWPIALSDLPTTAYLVGGAVRDALLGRCRSALDLDFVVAGEAIEVARAIAGRYGAGFVVLDRERAIARVAFAAGTLDFAQQVGGAIEADLQRRDFTINAIAYQPHHQQWIDPLQGRSDLARRQLRMVSPANLEDDPLRLLRAYRLSAQLDFAVEPTTAATIAEQAPNLARVAAERVRTELDYLLETTAADRILQAIDQVRLLTDWLPPLTPLQHQALTALDRATQALWSLWPAAPIALPLLNGRSALATARLANLLGQDLMVAESTLDRLKVSRADRRSLLAVVAALGSLPASAQSVPLDRAGQYAFCKAAGDSFPAAALLAIARGTAPTVLAEAITRWQDPSDRLAHPCSPMTGTELMAALNLPRGPVVGQVLLALERAQAIEQLSSPTAALAYARQWLAQRGI